ncbi:MAG: serine/threonine-protein kinase [Bradymonadia bacterium]|jgi:serine/threonine-protein kinase
MTVPPTKAGGEDNRDLHRRIGLAAMNRGYLGVRELSEAMLTVGADPAASPADIWVVSGALDRTELAEVMTVVRGYTGELGYGSRQSGLHHTPISNIQVEGGLDSVNLADVVQTYNGGGRGEAITSDVGIVDTQRYLIGAELGRGGVGRVLKAFDRDLGRTVAMKLPLYWPLPEDEADKFIEEAQATGQLEHPNIVPIYDIGRLPTGELYYTMKRVQAYSLRDVIEGLKNNVEHLVAEYGPTRLLNIFLQVCQAMHYAHKRGVVHRDLKPDNIMLGEYGEVHVMDWGLARIMDREVVTDRSLSQGHKAEIGQTVGTPAYMPPEQAKGILDQVNERSDVYSLGVILYEMVTMTQPSTRANVMATLMAVISEPIAPPSTVTDTPISEDMEHIIMKALEKDPADRYASAKELHDTVENFLDGRNEREADRRIMEGDRYARVYEHARREMLRLAEHVHEAHSKIEDWQSIEIKRTIWELEDRHRGAAIEMTTSFGDAIREFTQALAHVPTIQGARDSLARLYFSRYELAEIEENELDKVYFLSLLRQYDEGDLQARIQDSAPVSFYTAPEGAAVFLYSYEEVDRRLVVGKPQYLGTSPIPEQFIAAGSYLVRLKHRKSSTVHVPLSVHRSDPISLNTEIPADGAYRKGFTFVAGGLSIIGGDPDAFDPLPTQRVDVAPFFMQKSPVTFAEYAEFLDALAVEDLDEALERAPRTRGSDGPLVDLDANGRFLPSEVLIDGDMRARYPENEGHEGRLPVLAIRYEDALAYCMWRAGREGVPFRLPTEFEWERAARGADGRFYPWGNRFDANFCKMGGSRAVESQPEPVGSFPLDRSPFDVFELAGGVREWVESTGDDTYAIVRGGYWSGDLRASRSSSRWRFHRNARLATIGFRMVYSLPSF